MKSAASATASPGTSASRQTCAVGASGLRPRNAAKNLSTPSIPRYRGTTRGCRGRRCSGKPPIHKHIGTRSFWSRHCYTSVPRALCQCQYTASTRRPRHWGRQGAKELEDSGATRRRRSRTQNGKTNTASHGTDADGCSEPCPHDRVHSCEGCGKAGVRSRDCCHKEGLPPTKKAKGKGRGKKGAK